MPDPVCWLAIQHGPHTVDLALPSDAPVGVLLPSIVDLVGRGAIATDEGRRWHLSRIAQGPIDEMTSLHDNGVRDGELLLLTTTAMPAPAWVPDDPWRAVIDAADNRYAPTRVTATAACAAATVPGACALVWSGIVTHATHNVVTAGVAAVAATIGAVAVRRARRDSTICVTLSVVAVVFAAIAGFLAVPGGPSTASSLLAAAVACSTSVLLLRVTRCGAICLNALATLAALTSAASACAVAWIWPVTTMGASLSTLSLATLGAAPRLSIAAARLATAMSSSGDLAEAEPAPLTPRAITAHHTLTGLVIGSAGATALGSAIMASEPKGAVLAAVVGLVTMLRSRTHIGVLRRLALVVGGAAAIAASCAYFAVSTPAHASWIGLVSIAVGVSMLGGGFEAMANPLAHRAVEVLEYLALTAVVPLACWAGGLYDLIRGLSLP
jgi:type VII secretion integral membrane protein EccD